mmetsp:Transcript_10106/g.30246  ORF Transcript_10106/g.30246 Transcript_10106/m.30246 type:complete len:202 (-) Transcript_10106:456-1061(-)
MVPLPRRALCSGGRCWGLAVRLSTAVDPQRCCSGLLCRQDGHRPHLGGVRRSLRTLSNFSSRCSAARCRLAARAHPAASGACLARAVSGVRQAPRVQTLSAACWGAAWGNRGRRRRAQMPSSRTASRRSRRSGDRSWLPSSPTACTRAGSDASASCRGPSVAPILTCSRCLSACSPGALSTSAPTSSHRSWSTPPRAFQVS